MARSGRRDIQRKCLAAELRQRRCGQLQKFGAAPDLEAGHPDRLADVLADQCGNFVGRVLERAGRRIEPGDALMRRLLAVGREGDRGGGNRAIDAGCSGFRDAAD